MPKLQPALLVACLASLLAEPGCKKKDERTLRDSEGRTFSAACAKAKGCTLERRSGEPWPGPASAVSLKTDGQIVGVCNHLAGKGPESAGDCRALICEADSDCPPAHGRAQGTCMSNVCVDASEPITPSDAVMLCLWGMGLGREAPAQVERLAVGLNCGAPCEVPEPCHSL
jgi:hypothetical protein